MHYIHGVHLYDLFTHQISHSDSLKQNKFILHLAWGGGGGGFKKNSKHLRENIVFVNKWDKKNFY